MLGAIAGDIIGSRFEWHSTKSKKFPLFADGAMVTDDSILCVAVADAVLAGSNDFARYYRDYYQRYPKAGYGGRFIQWAETANAKAYQSYGNGSGMRVAPIGWLYDDLDQTLDAARATALPTHDHPAGIRGAQAVAATIFLARKGKDKGEIRRYVGETFRYDLNRRLEKIRPGYGYDVTCQGSVPEAIIAFLEATSVEDAIRNAVSLGGDSDTQACMAGAMAEAFYKGVPQPILNKIFNYLDPQLTKVVRAFAKKYDVPMGNSLGRRLRQVLSI